MALPLPITRDALDCSDLYLTVLPYVSQLYDLPQQLLQSYNDPAELRNIYLGTNPLITAFAFTLFISPIFLLVSEINRNYSQVDRFWSILPSIYNAHYVLYAHMAGLPTQRLDNLIAVSVVWSMRLTFNYWRRGGYSIGSEDYRWELLRKKIHPVLFFLFNVTFISLIQNVLLFLITTPTYVILLVSRVNDTMDKVDIAFARVMMVLILIEFFADQQQWDFQKAKKEYLKTAKVPAPFQQEDLDRGFVVTGLWSWCRHPNFAMEQAIWILMYQWGCFITDTMYNWTLMGAMGYIALFQGSTWFTESITASKYPGYKEYQGRVAKFIPRFSYDLISTPVEEEKETEVVAKAPKAPNAPNAPKSPKEAKKAKKGRK